LHFSRFLLVFDLELLLQGSSKGETSIKYDDDFNEQWKDIEDEQLGNEKFDIDDLSLLST